MLSLYLLQQTIDFPHILWGLLLFNVWRACFPGDDYDQLALLDRTKTDKIIPAYRDNNSRFFYFMTIPIMAIIFSAPWTEFWYIKHYLMLLIGCSIFAVYSLHFIYSFSKLEKLFAYRMGIEDTEQNIKESEITVEMPVDC